MPAPTLRQLLEAGVHFGHLTSRWNPRMRPYIFAARNGVHIIDLAQTKSSLEATCTVIRDMIAAGDRLLFVGTKKQAQDPIRELCERTGQHYVIHRWMGGMLTNFSVIQRRLAYMAELREMNERNDFARMSAKEANVHRDELDRLERAFAGMASMRRLPAALFVIDCKREHLAVNEANRLNIPVIAITDTNCDPDLVTHVIPGNDDAIRSIKLILATITESILEGQQLSAEREMREAQEIARNAALALAAVREAEHPEAAVAAVED